MSRSIFVNRTLNLKHIKYIGLDMDHTLIRYNTRAFEGLAHKIILEKLVSVKGYPQDILSLPFDFDRAIRGLVIDKPKGNILKLSRHSSIRVSYHGLQRIEYKAQKRDYRGTVIDLSDPQYDPVDTSFSIAFATIYGQLVDLKDRSQLDLYPDYESMANDIGAAMDCAHRDGSLKDVVCENLDSYIIKDPELVEGIERFIKHGKKIFIVTNSDYKYSKVLLDYAITPFLKDHKCWSDVFELTITSAQKPRFFYDNLRFLKVNPENATLTNMEGPLEKGIYQGGCASIFTTDLKLDADEILYIGDHIYGDIVRLKKDCSWRTALVIEELQDEVDKANKARKIEEKINELMKLKLPIETQIDQLICDKIEQGITQHEKQIDDLIAKVGELDLQIGSHIREMNKAFNSYWGEILRVGIEESFLAYQMERFACIYMARLSDFFTQSPRSYFRSSKRFMPHEPH
ncbi:MAG: HAD-IG family 5'-nucleotidase [Bdellovibrionales bacterium]|nr:HAD-IG family 5'-nucleotidase [Bdellovibrionales bacterium]